MRTSISSHFSNLQIQRLITPKRSNFQHISTLWLLKNCVLAFQNVLCFWNSFTCRLVANHWKMSISVSYLTWATSGPGNGTFLLIWRLPCEGEKHDSTIRSILKSIASAFQNALTFQNPFRWRTVANRWIMEVDRNKAESCRLVRSAESRSTFFNGSLRVSIWVDFQK